MADSRGDPRRTGTLAEAWRRQRTKLAARPTPWLVPFPRTQMWAGEKGRPKRAFTTSVPNFWLRPEVPSIDGIDHVRGFTLTTAPLLSVYPYWVLAGFAWTTWLIVTAVTLGGGHSGLLLLLGVASLVWAWVAYVRFHTRTVIILRRGVYVSTSWYKPSPPLHEASDIKDVAGKYYGVGPAQWACKALGIGYLRFSVSNSKATMVIKFGPIREPTSAAALLTEVANAEEFAADEQVELQKKMLVALDGLPAAIAAALVEALSRQADPPNVELPPVPPEHDAEP